MALPITPPSCFIIQPKRHRGTTPPSSGPFIHQFHLSNGCRLKICVFLLGIVTESLDVALLNRSRRIRTNERTYTHSHSHRYAHMKMNSHAHTRTYNENISIELPMGHVQHLYLNFNVSDSTHSQRKRRRRDKKEGQRGKTTPTLCTHTHRRKAVTYAWRKGIMGSARHLL